MAEEIPIWQYVNPNGAAIQRSEPRQATMEAISILAEGPIGETAGGELTACISICVGDWSFPERSWRDFVSVLPGWWETAAFDLAHRGAAVMAFMDGPFEVRLKMVSDEEVEAEFVFRTSSGYRTEKVVMLQRRQLLSALVAGSMSAAQLLQKAGHTAAAEAVMNGASRT